MRAAVVDSFTAPPRYAEFPEPVPTSEEVLVTVTAAGLHPLVRSTANGSHYGSPDVLPFVPGVDGVGRLESGARVYFTAGKMPFGSFAERSLTRPATSLPIPDSLDDAWVAAAMNPAMSSWAALTCRAHFAAGESVLILGATGTAGQLAVQIARRLGASRVVVAGRNTKALEELLQCGADAAIPLTQDRAALVSSFREEIAKSKIDVILDYLWGAPAETVLEAIAQKGLQHTASRIRFVQIGSIAGPTITLSSAPLRSVGLELMGSGFGSVSMEQIFQSLAAFLQEAAKKPFALNVVPAPLGDITALWNAGEQSERLVFLP